MSTSKSLLAELPARLPDELIQPLVQSEAIRIERIVSAGHSSPPGFWYDQDMHEWVLLVSGKARLRFEGRDEPVEMVPGSYVNIEAHTRHRVEWTEPNVATVWVAVHYR
jgi:cupin 2 domain-containing protein